MPDGEVMGSAQSRRSARLARRQQRAEDEASARREITEEEDSDPEYQVEAMDTEDEDATDGTYAMESDGTDDGASELGAALQQHYFLHLSGITGGSRGRQNNLSKLLAKYGPVPKEVPPLKNDLSQELERATAALPTKFDTQVASGSQAAISRTAVPRNTTQMVFERQANLLGFSSGWQRSQCCHMTALHYLPNRPLTLRARMHSRAYIGRHSHQGDLFIGAFQADKRVRVYDTNRDWQLVKDVHARNLRWTITDTCLSSDQRFLLYATITPVVHLVDVGAGGVESEANVTEIHEALNFDDYEWQDHAGDNFGIFSISWSADGKNIAAGTGNMSILLFDTEKQKTIEKIRGHQDDVNAVAFLDESSNLIVTGSDDHTIKVWDRRSMSRSNKAAGVLVGHTQGITHLDSKGDGRYLLSNSKDQSAKVWDLRTMLSASKFAKLPASDLPRFGWDYRWMSYPGRGYNIRHPADCSLQTLRGHYVATTLIRAYWSPLHSTGQRYVYSGSADGTIYIWDVITGNLVSKLSYHQGDNPHKEILRDVSWHPYQQSLVSAGFDGALVEWGYSSEPLSFHLVKLPDTGYDNLEENW